MHKWVEETVDFLTDWKVNFAKFLFILVLQNNAFSLGKCSLPIMKIQIRCVKTFLTKSLLHNLRMFFSTLQTCKVRLWNLTCSNLCLSKKQPGHHQIPPPQKKKQNLQYKNITFRIRLLKAKSSLLRIFKTPSLGK